MLIMRNDIQTRADIRKLISVFYEKLLSDEVFKNIFLVVAKIDVLEHLDLIVDFWESVLFQAGKYKRDLIDIHLDLNQKVPNGLKKEHFNNWLAFFIETIDELYQGEKANGAKDRALFLAKYIKMKIDKLEQMRLELNN
jgi:hemoglobin